MKIIWPVILSLALSSCGKADNEGKRCRSAEEAQMKCQIDYAEKYRVYLIPDHIKDLCKSYYSAPGCYFDEHARYHW